MATSDEVYAAAARRITANNPALAAPYGRRSRFALFVLLLASHALTALAGAYVAAKAAEAPADVCPVSAPAVRAQVWL